MIGFDVPPETRPDVQAAMTCVGYEARLSGWLRLVQAGSVGRLQQEWRGEFGTAWLDVPVHHFTRMPARSTSPTAQMIEPSSAVAADPLDTTLERLCQIADRAAQAGYAEFDEPRLGDAATEAREDLDSPKHAIAILKDERRLWRAAGAQGFQKLRLSLPTVR